MAEAFFEFRVLSPEQRKGAGALELGYWTYKIRASTSLSMYPRKEMEVVRRYSDFEWFRTQLSEAYPYCIVPPIPEKDVKGTLNKIVGSVLEGGTKLRDYRQRALKKFLVRLGAHPLLHTSTLLQDFLEMDESEWERKMRAPVKNSDRTLSNTLGEGVNSAFVRQWNAAGVMVSSGDGYNKMVTNGCTNPQILEETRLYIQQLEDSIRMLRERVQMLVDRRKNTSTALHEFGVSFEKIGDVERGIEPTPLSNALIAVGHHSEQLSSIYVEHAGDETKQVVETLSYYSGMCGSVRETLKRLQNTREQVESLTNHVADLTSQREKALLRGGQADRVAKMDHDLNLLQQRLETLRRGLETGEAIFKDEIRRFHQEKQYDVKAILKTFAELQLKYAARMRETWEKLLPTLDQVRFDDDGAVKGGS